MNKNIYVQIILLILGSAGIIIAILIATKTIKTVDNFENDTQPINTIYETIEKDRTKLYGSLFLDKLNEQIKNLTDPKINYSTKRIDIIKYNDILL